jgi:hypothetical protein
MRKAIFARTGMDFAVPEIDFAGAGLGFDSGNKDFNGADVIYKFEKVARTVRGRFCGAALVI